MAKGQSGARPSRYALDHGPARDHPGPPWATTQRPEAREETLALRKAKLGPRDPDTLQSMEDVGISYYTLDRHTEAMKLSEDTLAAKGRAGLR